MPTELLASGVPTSVLQNTVYALPAGASAIESTVGLEISDNGTTWAALTKSASSKRFVRCASGNAIILVRSLSKAIQEYEVIGAPALTYQQQIVADGAIAYWPLDETSGTTAFDKVGTRHGTISGGVTLNQAGVNGSKCMVFDGSNGINVGPLPRGANMTLEAWVNLSAAPPSADILGGIGSAGEYIWQYLGPANGGPHARLTFIGGITAGINVPQLVVGAWIYLAISNDGTTSSFFVNGSQVGAPLAQVPIGTPMQGALGSQYPTFVEAWFGKLQDIAIYNRALTPAEIQSHYTKRLEGAPFGGLVSTDQLVSLWEFDADFQDKVGTNHLTNNGGVTRVPGKLGNAADFERDSSQYLRCLSNASLDPGDIDFTLVVWVKLESLDTYGIISKDSEFAFGEGYRIDVISSGHARFFINSSQGGIATSSTPVSVGEWALIIAWHSATANTVNIQLNNGTAVQANTSAAPITTSHPFTIGAISSNNYYFDGLIDQPLLFKRILSAAERTAMWNSGNGLRY